MVVFRRDILDLKNGSILIGLSKDINGARVAGCLQKGIPEFQSKGQFTLWSLPPV